MNIQEQKSQNDPNFRLFNLTISAQTIQEQIDKRLAELAPNAKMPGFRPGKIPLDILRKNYEGQLTEEALQESVNLGLSSIVKEHQLVPAMDPDVHIDSYKPGQDLKCSIGIVPLPSLELPDFSTIALTRDKPLIDDSHIDKTLQDLQKQRATSKIIEPRPFKEGDAVIIDYEGLFPDKNPVPGAKGENILVEIGTNSFSPELEKELLKAKVGDTVVTSISYPNDHPRHDLAGTSVSYSMNVKELREFILPPINEEFCKSLGMPSVDDLRNTVKQSILHDFEWEAQELLKRSLLDQLNVFFKEQEPPQKMIEREYTGIWQQYITSKQENTLSKEEAELSEEKAQSVFSSLAKRRVRLALVLTTVSRLHEIAINEQEIDDAIQQISQQNPNNAKDVKEHYKQFSARQQLHANLMERKIINFILSKVQINEQEIPLEDFQKKIRDAESFNAEEETPQKKESKPSKVKKETTKSPAPKKPSKKKESS
jgi:trigger factor